jgi:hypothetical protein
MANYILMVQLEFDPEHADELNRLYDVEHVPNLLSVDGVVAAQRYELDSNADNQLKYLAIYELERAEIPDSDEWKKAATTPDWMAVRQHITDRRRGVFRKI